MIHLLNYVWPNVFEASPAHLVNAVHEAIEGLRAALGSTTLLQYTLQVPGPSSIGNCACACLFFCFFVRLVFFFLKFFEVRAVVMLLRV